MSVAEPLSILGIRHHGPGSARSVRRALESLSPDCVLIEGPPDAAEILPLAADKGLKPPVAILVYAPDEPSRAVYYPFASFSPEWQAIQYALKRKVPVRFMDLPQAHRFGEDEERTAGGEDEKPSAAGEGDAADEAVTANTPGGAKSDPATTTVTATASPGTAPAAVAGTAPAGAAGATDPAAGDAASLASEPAPAIEDQIPDDVRRDPLVALARAAGYEDGERWWEHVVEQRRADDAGVFDAIREAMAALREALPQATRPDDLRREAYMRQTIRAAQQEGFERVAVVCGAWHAPALDVGRQEARGPAAGPGDVAAAAEHPARIPSAKDDAAALKNLPKAKVAATWIPWTYGRLTFASGSGAGVESPGWYDHLFHHTTAADREGGGGDGRVVVRWMTRVARLFREQDIDCSSAHVIESVRLAETLANMRGRTLPDLAELNDAARAVFCFDTDVAMRLIAQKLIVGERLGEVPDDAPAVPLQHDLAREQKRLRLKPEATWKDMDLDLRKELDLDRSRLLHRLNLLGVGWGKVHEGSRGKGTFRESWRIEWHPEFAVRIIEAGTWGNTVAGAAATFTRDAADKAKDLPSLTRLLDHVLLADLPDAVDHVMRRLENEAAVASDIAHLMDALPPLASVLRYGNVRQTDASMVGHAVTGLVARVTANLPNACGSLDDDAAAAMYGRIGATNTALSLLQNADHLAAWRATLRHLSNAPNLHGLVAGFACRLLMDAGDFDADESAQRLGLALSTANDPKQAADWIEGFLKGSGAVLLHDEGLWRVLDDWVSGLRDDAFTALLPLLRRTFATFEPAERRQMGQRVKRGPVGGGPARGGGEADADVDHERAALVLPVLRELLGLNG